MRLSLCFIYFFVFVSAVAVAQEFWIEPVRFRVKEGEEILLTAMSGDGIPGDPLDPKKGGILEANSYAASGKNKLPALPRFSFKPLTPGTYLIAMQSQPGVKEWTATDFESYLKDNGLDDIITDRKKSGLSGQRVTETTIRFAKTILQVGATKDSKLQQAINDQLEIIPTKNPSELVVGDHLKCKVMFQGKPSAHTLIRVWSMLNRTTFLQNIYTEDDGTFVFPISTKGMWMISVLRMVPGENPATEWKSYRGSFMFGI